MSIVTDYTAEDIAEETLMPHPALRRYVELIEAGELSPTICEAMLIDVIVRQQMALSAVVAQNVGYLLKHGPLRHDVVA